MGGRGLFHPGTPWFGAPQKKAGGVRGTNTALLNGVSRSNTQTGCTIHTPERPHTPARLVKNSRQPEGAPSTGATGGYN